LPDRSQQGTGAARLTGVAALLAASVLLSRVLGLVRDRVLAHQIGAGAETDAYGAAFLLPDILNHFLAGGALSIAFIPLYSRVRAEAGDTAAQRLFAKVLGTMSAAAVLATLVLWWWAESLIPIAFPRFAPETQALTVRITRIVLPAQIFFVAGGIVRAVLMAHGRFASQALAPLVYNVGIIAGGVLLGGTLGAEGFAWGALAGAVLGPFLMALIEMARLEGVALRLRLAPLDRDLFRYLALAAPLMLGVTLLTVDEWYDKLFGGLYREGTVAALGYARRLMLVPVGAVGQAIATAALPLLSQLWAQRRRDELDRVMLGALRAGLGLAILGTAGCLALAQPIVAFVVETGRFTTDDTVRVAGLLCVFAFALPAWITQQIAVRAFYARAEMWRPMLLGTAVALAAIPLYLALGDRFGATGLAAAGAVAMTVNAAATLAYARLRHGGPPLGGLLSTGLRAAGIAAAAGAAAWYAQSGGSTPFAQLLLGGGGFAAVGLAGVFLLGDAPMREVLARVSRRRGRGREPG
jgi:putative peptidoglycan lipid II flippase